RASGRASDRPVQDRGAVTAGDPGGSFGRNAGGGLSGVHHSGHAGDNPWDLLLAPRERPDWFDVASGAVLAGADAVLAAGGPRGLEQATVDLVGAQLRVVVRGDGLGLWFDWWFEELVGVLAGRVEEESAGSGRGWQAPWWLLHGLTSIGSPGLAGLARRTVQGLSGRVAAASRRDPSLRRQPEWL